MKKILVLGIMSLFLFVSNAFAIQAKGLNVVLTSDNEQTQMMAMVLSMKTLAQKKKVYMTLCSNAGDLAVKGMKSSVLKPLDKSPKMLLKALIKKGAQVNICPLYLPNANKDKSVLLKGITVAKPINVATQLLNKDYTILSY